MQSQQLVLISGIPGTGKSSFARWLQDEHGFFHYDVDTVRTLPTLAWILQQDRLVVDWGFPPNDHCFEVIESWATHGVSQWWFDGDRDAALQSFMLRGTVSKKAWDIQLTGITQNWPKIEALFPAGRRLAVLDAARTYLPKQEIYAAIFASDA